jgi:hypothetical protein
MTKQGVGDVANKFNHLCTKGYSNSASVQCRTRNLPLNSIIVRLTVACVCYVIY